MACLSASRRPRAGGLSSSVESLVPGEHKPYLLKASLTVDFVVHNGEVSTFVVHDEASDGTQVRKELAQRCGLGNLTAARGSIEPQESVAFTVCREGDLANCGRPVPANHQHLFTAHRTLRTEALYDFGCKRVAFVCRPTA